MACHPWRSRARLAALLALLTAALVAAPAHAAQGWLTQTPSTATDALHAVGCSTTTCVAVGGGGAIVRRVSGTWSVVNSGVTADLNGVSCWSDTGCVAVGDGGQILRYNGSVLASQASPGGATASMLAVDCWSSTTVTCVAVGAGGAIWRNTDTAGSGTWSAMTSPTSATINDVSCASATVCLAAADGDVVLGLNASTWSTAADFTLGGAFSAIDCFSSSVCTVVGAGGNARRTTDGGTTWTTQSTGVTDDLRAVECPTETRCFAGGAAGRVVATADAETWFVQTSSATGAVTGIDCRAPATCTLAGGNLTTDQSPFIRATTDGGAGGWIVRASGTSSDLRAIDCPTATTCFAGGVSGSDGVILRSTDSGVSWTSSTLTGAGTVYAISCFSATQCVAGTSVHTWTYDGTTWTQRTEPGTATAVRAIACPSATLCYAGRNDDPGSSSDFQLIRSFTGGTSWSAAQAVGATVRGISCAGPFQCSAVGEAGAQTAAVTLDGNYWASSATNAGGTLLGISCPAISFCASVGEGGVAAKSDGAYAWLNRASQSTQALHDVACTDASTCVYAGAGGAIGLTDDGTATWVPQASPTSAALYGADANNAGSAVLVGDGGTILQYFDVVGASCTSGGLSMSAPSSLAFGSISLIGSRVASVVPTITVNQQNAANSGWSVSATSTQFSDGAGHTFPSTATRITSTSVATGSTNCSVPTNSITYPLTLPAGSTAPTAAKIVNAASGTGAGPVVVKPTFELTVPQNARATNYSSTVTLTLSSAP